MHLGVAITAFLLIFPVELPDKTFVATIVLATRYRPLPVWIGVSAAFFVQCVVAVTAGGLIALLPRRLVLGAAAALFLVGAVVLLRGAKDEDAEAAAEETSLRAKLTHEATGLRAVTMSFLVLFLAEWGDFSQLLTVALVVRYHDPVSVFVGSWLALVVISALGAVLGRTVTRFVRLSTVRRVGGGLCGVLAVLTGFEAAGVSPF